MKMFSKLILTTVVAGLFSLSALADPTSAITVTIQNGHVFGNQLALVDGSVFPTRQSDYCPAPAPNITNSYQVGFICGTSAKAKLSQPSSPTLTYTLYEGSVKTPILTCRLDYTFCTASVTPIFKSAAPGVKATCTASAIAQGNHCDITFAFQAT